MNRFTRVGLARTEIEAYDLGWRDAFLEFNAAMNEFAENMKYDQPKARRVMKERLTIAMQLHAKRGKADEA